MNLIFFSAHTFLIKEIINALSRRRDISSTVVELPERLPAEAAADVFERLKPNLPAIILSINNAGYDYEGALSDRIAASGSHAVNWFTDHPFYEEVRWGRRRPNPRNRIDFVTENAFVDPMNAAGINARFLPLATDPAYFSMDGAMEYARDIAFVGNSSLEFMDALFTDDLSHELERFAGLINRCKDRYCADPRFDIAAWLRANPSLWCNQTTVAPELFVFLVEWMAGYLYRREFIVGISRRYGKRFTCFGDIYWTKFITDSHVSTDACYYTNLCAYYRSTRINLNLNRIQVPTSFTQRIFDCKAAGAFVLTEKRALNSRFFVADGPHREFVEFGSMDECARLIDYYLAHDDERERIAGAGSERVLREHTYDCRIDAMLRTCAEAWGI
jgi:spore maturation protein CgeB